MTDSSRRFRSTLGKWQSISLKMEPRNCLDSNSSVEEWGWQGRIKLPNYASEAAEAFMKTAMLLFLIRRIDRRPAEEA